MFCYFKSACSEDILLCWMHALGCRNVFFKIIRGVLELVRIFIGAWEFSNFIVICICINMLFECFKIDGCSKMLDKFCVRLWRKLSTLLLGCYI